MKYKYIGALVCACLILPGVARGAASLAGDFSVFNGNPNGNWLYGYKTLAQSPSSAIPLPDVYNDGFTWAWHPTSAIASFLPFVAKNTTGGSYTDGFTWLPAGEIVACSGDSYDSVMKWTAPTSGLYQIDATYRGLSIAGTTSQVLIYEDNTLLSTTPVIGFDTAFGGSLSPIVVPSSTLFMSSGQSISFVVNNYNGTSTSDSTGVAATITAVPEPGSLGLIGCAIALTQRRSARKHRRVS